MAHYPAAYRVSCHGCDRTRRIGRDQAVQPYELPAGGRCGGPMMVRPGCRAAGLHCLAELARALPADTACQITRTAERLGFTDYSDVLAEVANAVTRKASRPKAVRRNVAPRLADATFPHKTPVTQCRDEPQRYSSSGQALARSTRERSTYYFPERSRHHGQGL